MFSGYAPAWPGEGILGQHTQPRNPARQDNQPTRTTKNPAKTPSQDNQSKKNSKPVTHEKQKSIFVSEVLASIGKVGATDY